MEMRFTRLLNYVLFLTLAVWLAYVAFSSRTDSIYVSISPLLLPIYFVITAFLFWAILNEKLPLGDKFLVVILHSFLTRIIFLIILYPGVSGDSFQHLARERTWDIYGEYYLNLWPEPLPYLQNPLTKLFAFQRALFPYGLVVSLSKMLYIDLYWIHHTALSVLWSFFVPIIGFRVAKTLGGNDRTCLLAGSLTASAPTIIGYSLVSAANTFGFFLFYVTIYLLLRTLSSEAKHNRRNIIMLLIAVSASLIAHSQTGIVSFMLIILALSLKASSAGRSQSRMAFFIMPLGLAVSFILLPASSVALKYVYAAAPTSFSLKKTFDLSVYHIIFANYADYTLNQALMYGTLSFLGILGMLLYKAQDENKKLISLFLTFAFVALATQYRIFYYFIENPPFGIHRLLVFLPFVTAPFTAISIDFLLKKIRFPPVPLRLRSNRSSSIKLNFEPKRIFVIFLIGIGLSGLLVEGCLSNFKEAFRYGPIAIVSVTSLEAVELIHEEYQKTREKYVAITDGTTDGAGASVVGLSNPNEFYVQNPFNRDYYLTALSEVSPEPLAKAAGITKARLVYLLVSKWSVGFYLGPTANYEKIISRLSRLYEILSVVGSGDGEMYIFRFKVPLAPFQGIGPAIKVFRDSQWTSLNTTYSYEAITSVVYTLNLTGSSSYNVTGWPAHWSYEKIKTFPLNASIDANAWISFSGYPDQTYEVTWLANEVFQNVTWKEDAFLKDWASYKHKNGSHSWTSDGDIATLRASGDAGYYVHLEKKIPELRGSLMLMARFNGTSNSRVAFSLYEQTDATKREAFWSGWKRPSSNYALLDFSLPLDCTFFLMRIWIMTSDGSLISVSLDYVMILYD